MRIGMDWITGDCSGGVFVENDPPLLDIARGPLGIASIWGSIGALSLTELTRGRGGISDRGCMLLGTCGVKSTSIASRSSRNVAGSSKRDRLLLYST